MGNFENNELQKFGTYVENRIVDRLSVKYPKTYNDNKPGVSNKKWDIVIPETKKTIEVKADYISVRTGNLLVEVSGWDGNSGLRTTKADWWVFVTGFRLIWITPLELYRFIEMHPEFAPYDSKINGKGDTYNKGAYKIKHDDFVLYIYNNLKNNEGKIQMIKSKNDPLFYMNCLEFNDDLKGEEIFEIATKLSEKQNLL